MYTTDQIINDVEAMLVSGDLNTKMFSDNFEFNSPIWEKANKADFIAHFEDPADYRKKILPIITHFDPLIKYTDKSGKHFSIISQYHTKNGSHVYQVVMCTVESGLLSNMRFIYDLEEMKVALEMN